MNPDVRIETSDELMAAARARAWCHDPTVVERIDAALEVHTDPYDLGTLHLARALATQGAGDARDSVASVLSAIPLLRKAGQDATAAYASAMAAVWVDQTGDVARAVELAVDALTALDGAELAEFDTVRASLALAGLFLRISAFDRACAAAEQALDGALALDDVPIETVAYTAGYVCAEAAHLATDESVRRARAAVARRAAEWLSDNGADPVVSVMLGGGLHAEIDHALGDDADRSILAAGADHYAVAGADLVAWHQLVRATAAHRAGDREHAIALLDESIPGLAASADNHCLVRALTIRAASYAATGRPDAAYDDALRLARATRRWQLDQVGPLADQISYRAQLEVTRLGLQTTAEQLSRDLDLDPATGARSRYWLEHRLDSLVDGSPGSGAVMMADIDTFKSVNDRFGHAIGDRALAGVVATLADAAGDDAEIARYGGDELMVITAAMTVDEANALAERMRAAVAAHDWTEIQHGLALTISIGIAHGSLAFPRTLADHADRALLAAKERGRNCVAVAN